MFRNHQSQRKWELYKAKPIPSKQFQSPYVGSKYRRVTTSSKQVDIQFSFTIQKNCVEILLASAYEDSARIAEPAIVRINL